MLGVFACVCAPVSVSVRLVNSLLFRSEHSALSLMAFRAQIPYFVVSNVFLRNSSTTTHMLIHTHTCMRAPIQLRFKFCYFMRIFCTAEWCERVRGNARHRNACASIQPLCVPFTFPPRLSLARLLPFVHSFSFDRFRTCSNMVIELACREYEKQIIKIIIIIGTAHHCRVLKLFHLRVHNFSYLCSPSILSILFTLPFRLTSNLSNHFYRQSVIVRLNRCVCAS